MHVEALTRYTLRHEVRPGRRGRETKRKGKHVFRAIADVLRQIGGAVATVVTLPFRALARLFGGASSTARGHRA
ncbi:hypothetical protein SUDANB126_00920 [Streptomyces sp. enrichment culture]